MTITIAVTIATTTVMSINIKAFILEPFHLSRCPAFANKTFHFDCGVNLSHCSIGIVEWGIVVAPVVSGLILGASREKNELDTDLVW